MEIDHRILEKYWSGQCTEEEQKAVEKWLEGDIPDQDYTLKTNREEAAIQEQLWANIQASADVPQPETGSYQPKATTKSSTYVGIAASLLLLISFTYYWFSLQTDGLPVHAYKQVQAPRGKKVKIQLSDGSTVFLHAGSSIRYPATFRSKKRHIMLSGEAYFDVAQKSDQPFIVETKDTRTEVLGTAFALRHYTDDPYTRLVVEQGKVRFTTKDGQDALILTANQCGLYENGHLTDSEVYAAAYTAWKDNRMVINGATLAELIPELERWYAIRITLRNTELGKNRIKASFENPSVSSLLHDLAFTMNFKYQIKNKEVSIYK